MKILIVDDYPGAVEASRYLLEALGHECAIATSGKAALDQVESFNPDILLLDLALPDVSGYEVAKAIRSRAESRRTFIAAVSGTAARAQVADGEFDAFVEKPFERKSLEDVIRKASG